MPGLSQPRCEPAKIFPNETKQSARDSLAVFLAQELQQAQQRIAGDRKSAFLTAENRSRHEEPASRPGALVKIGVKEMPSPARLYAVFQLRQEPAFAGQVAAASEGILGA